MSKVAKGVRGFFSKRKNKTAPTTDESTSNIDAARPSRQERQGLLDLNPGYRDQIGAGKEAFDVDIVAIHGLNGDFEDSWTDRETGKLWLRDSLPEDLPGARIFSFGYEASVFFNKHRVGLLDFANDLLVRLSTVRSDIKRRPIIFLAHSLGGIVCKQALVRAQQEPRYHTILEDTTSILFFGTPHRGSDIANTFSIAANLYSFASKPVSVATGKMRNDLVKDLETESKELARVNGEFRHRQDAFHIVSLYETKNAPGLGKLVSALMFDRLHSAKHETSQARY